MAFKVKKVIFFQFTGSNFLSVREQVGINKTELLRRLGGANNGWYYKMLQRFERPGTHLVNSQQMQEILTAFGQSALISS